MSITFKMRFTIAYSVLQLNSNAAVTNKDKIRARHIGMSYFNEIHQHTQANFGLYLYKSVSLQISYKSIENVWSDGTMAILKIRWSDSDGSPLKNL